MSIRVRNRSLRNHRSGVRDRSLSVDQGYTGEVVAAQAAEHGIQFEVVKLPHAKHGFVLLPRRWVVERSFAWASRFRRLARDYERLPSSFAALHWLAFGGLMLASIFSISMKSS